MADSKKTDAQDKDHDQMADTFFVQSVETFADNTNLNTTIRLQPLQQESGMSEGPQPLVHKFQEMDTKHRETANNSLDLDGDGN